MSSVPRDSYIYSIDPHEWDDSSFPRALIPTTVATCANLHVFPPVSPSFYHRIELGEGGPSSAANAAGVAPAPRRSARAHAASVSSLTAFPSLGAGGTRAPTETTHQLLAKLGAVRYVECGLVHVLTVQVSSLLKQSPRPRRRRSAADARQGCSTGPGRGPETSQEVA
jgi:hypothetical protein